MDGKSLPESISRRILPGEFYRRSTLEVACDLLGKIFVRIVEGEALAGRIVEVEAYHEDGDEASHSFRGRTARNAAMFRAGGILYVYFTYGMHYCMNVVTEREGVGAAVLIRALYPLTGIPRMRRNRGKADPPERLTDGPAKCCRAFGIDRTQDGLPLTGPDLFVLDAPGVEDRHVRRTPRIGIRRSADLPWRFVLGDPEKYAASRSGEEEILCGLRSLLSP
ncbi:MAG: DNA-3-methyladenine glycosylase [Bacteroidota bacterium]|nr:DNA-3-methyladenine glycosylase [Bacteroidota bacterium]